MAIKFRRIEDRKESIIQLRRREVDRTHRRRVVPKVVILLLVLAGAAACLLYFRPPRIVAPFVVRVDSVQISSPLAGTVEWLISRETKEIHAGDVIARISTQPATADSPTARLTDLRLRAAEATAQLKTEQANRDVAVHQLQEQQRQLKEEVERWDEPLRRAETEAEEARGNLDFRRRNLESAESLMALDAITRDDYLTARRAQESAQAAYDAAESRLRGLKAELVAARETLTAFQNALQASMALADSRVQGALAMKDALDKPVHSQTAAFSEDEGEFIVRAPSSGILLELNVTEKSHVFPGDSLLKLYKPESKVAGAYVAVRYRESLKKGATARLYGAGHKEPAVGEVTFMDARVVPLPPSLERRVGYGEANAISVDIRFTEAAGAPFLPGETGKAVIE